MASEKKSKKNLGDIFKFSWGVENDIFDLNKTSHNVIGVDTGGTKTLIAHVDRDIIDAARKKTIGINQLSAVEYFTNKEFESLEAIIEAYLKKYNIDPAHSFISIAAAGPVENDKVIMSNYNWTIDRLSIQSRFHFLNAYIMNDLESLIYSVENIDPSHKETLNNVPRKDFAPVAVISPGTGLGESFGVYVPEKGNYMAVGSEGGNSDFAPSNDLEFALFKYLKEKKGYVSWEDTVSGKGLVNIFMFLQDNGSPADPETLDKINEGDAAEVITQKGLEGTDGSCRKTLEIFASLLGSEAGNLALKALPFGGLYISGGIPPKIKEIFSEPFFLDRFLSKGRLRPVLEKIPVYLLTNSSYGVIGAINYALLK